MRFIRDALFSTIGGSRFTFKAYVEKRFDETMRRLHVGQLDYTAYERQPLVERALA